MQQRELKEEFTTVIPKILWLDDDELVLSSARRLLRAKNWNLLTANSPQVALELVKQNEFAVIISDQRMPVMTGIEFFKHVLNISPNSTRLLVSGFLDPEVLKEAINIGKIFRLLSKPWDDVAILFDIEKAIQHHVAQNKKARLLQELKLQNLQLEDFTIGLEKLVIERTHSIELAKDEASEKQKRMRKVIQFVKDLAEAHSVESLLSSFRKELKPFHEVREPILVVSDGENSGLLHYYNGQQYIVKSTIQKWGKSQNIRVHALDDQVFLANQFGRPIIKVIAIPLRRRDDEDVLPPVLFLEHTLNDELVTPFLESISEKLQTFSIALDRILLRDQLQKISLQWEQTFDQIEDPIAIVDNAQQVLRANKNFNEMQNDFSKKEWEIVSYPIQMKSGSASNNIVNYYVDITESRALYRKMIQTEKVAALGLLSGNIAHELNNPLTGIRSLAQLWKMELDTKSPLWSDMDEIEKAAARSQQIIKDLWEFAHAEPNAEDRICNLNELIKKTLPLLKTALRDHNLEVIYCEQDCFILANPNLIQQVIFNLLNNASQAMKSPGVIRVETEIINNKCVMMIKDSGVGMTEEVKNKIFEPFFTTKEVGKGTGLGLSVVKNIIEKYNGIIEVESILAKGTTFTISFEKVSN